MASIASTTSSTPFQFPGNTLMDRNPATGNLFCMVKSTTADQYDLYRSTNTGGSWSLLVSLSRASIAEIGSIFVDNVGILHWAYRTNEASQDRIYYRRIVAEGGGWDSEVLLASIGNGGSGGSVLQGIDLISVHTTPATYVAVAVGITSGANIGVVLWGVRISAGFGPVNDNSILGGTREWHAVAGSGRIGPSVDLQHAGDGKSAGTPNLWVAWGRLSVQMVRMAWNGAGWTGPSSPIDLVTLGTGQSSIPGRYDGNRFVVAVPNPTTTDTVQLYERNSANSSTTVWTSPSHPTGVVKDCGLSYNDVSGDARVYAVGTSTTVLYYVDFIRATNSWSSWTQVLATAVLGAAGDNYGVRRGSYGTAQHHVYTAHSGSPNTLVSTAQTLSYAPNTPTWLAPQGGSAQDVNQALLLDWVFSDPDPADTQSAFAVSRQVGAGALNYWRASDSSWQIAEVQNTSGTSAITLASGWAAGSDANYTFKAKVWDSASTASGYSAGLVVVPSVKVNPTVTSPAVAAVLTTSSVPVTWTVSEETAYQLTLTAANVLDSFPRTVSSSWGSTDTGQAYTLTGTAANFAVGSGVGTITPGATSSDRLAVVTADTGADRTVETTLKWAALPATGVLRAGVLARYVDASNFLLGEISIATTGVVTVQATKNVAGVKTVLATYTHPTVYVGGVNWRVRCDVAGTRIRVKAWRAADSEPDYQIDTTDSSITTGTLAGAFARNETAVTTHVASFDTFSAVNMAASYDSGWVASTTTSSTPTLVLGNNTAWNLSLRTKNLEGLASEWATVGFTVVFIAPATPTLAAAPNPVTGTIAVVVTNPTPGGGQPALSTQDLYRRVVGATDSGLRIAAGLGSGATYADWTATSGVAYEYRILAMGANGTTTFSAWTA